MTDEVTSPTLTRSARVKSILIWLYEHWKLVTSVLVIIAIVVPGPYSWFVSWLPKSFYYIGDLGNPPAFDARPEWQADLPVVDQAQPADRLDRVISYAGRLAHLYENTPFIPAHYVPRGTDKGPLDRDWTDKQCLYVDDVQLVLLREAGVGGQTKPYGAIDPQGPHFPNNAIGMSAAEILRRTPKGGLPAQVYLTMLPVVAKSGQCVRTGDGKRCARIAVWAYGSPVPCSLSLFGALMGLGK